eukprot:10035701-Lingulodinium_polyedra.AAC.1
MPWHGPPAARRHQQGQGEAADLRREAVGQACGQVLAHEHLQGTVWQPVAASEQETGAQEVP